MLTMRYNTHQKVLSKSQRPSGIIAPLMSTALIAWGFATALCKRRVAPTDALSLTAKELADSHYTSHEGTTTVLTFNDFLAEPNIVAWLSEIPGLDLEHASLGEVLRYVPLRVEINISAAKRIGGDVGKAAAGGFVAFDLVNLDGSGHSYSSSLLLILHYDTGKIARVYPTFAQAPQTHYCGLKLKDPRTLLLAGDLGISENGPKYLFDWRNGTLRELSDGLSSNCHDVQWGYSGDSIWFPGTAGVIIKASSIDGQIMQEIELIGTDAADINHVDLIENDTMVIASSRLSDAIIKAKADTGEVNWIAGGPNGTMYMRDLAGRVYEPGTSALFMGQHNAEYFGEQEYAMFDNSYESGNASRLLIVEIDETQNEVREVWDYSFAKYPWGYSPIFGDNDRLPTGNFLASFWPSVLSGEAYENIRYEAKIVEIERQSKAVVWSADFFGELDGCDSSECVRDRFCGWKMYSVERFYEAPLVTEISCPEPGVVSFTAFNNFKQNNRYPGAASVIDRTGVEIARQQFEWTPHWRPTNVVVVFDPGDPHSAGDLDLVVTNQFGDSTSVELECVK